MNPLKNAVHLLGKEDVRAFKLFANRVEKQDERQDLALFDMIRQLGDDYDEHKAQEILYPDASSNAFHRLKSRLLGDINKSLVNQYLSRYDALKLYHFLSVVEFYLQKHHFDMAHWFLRKAERLALRMNHYEGLDIIYTEFIRLANEGLIINPEDYILKRQENQKMLNRLRQLDDVLAMVTHRVKTTQTYGNFGDNLIQMLETTVSEFADAEAVQNSPKVRLRMYNAISSILLDRRDYPALETYCRTTYEEFEKDNLFTKNNHRTKLSMLTYLVNSLQKNNNMEEAVYYARRLHAAAKAYDQLFYKDFIFFYYNAMMVSYFKLDLDKALQTLDEMEKDPIIQETPFYVLFVILNQALVYNEKGEYKAALKQFVKSYIHDSWKAADKQLALRIRMAELMVRYEVREYEVLQARIRQFKNDFQEDLETATFKRELLLAELLDQMNETLDPHKDESIVAAGKQFLATPQAPDAELINYEEFIRKQLRI